MPLSAELESASAPRHRIVMACCLFLCVFLILFPKGGFKAGPVPLTWGYLLLALTGPILLAVRLVALPLRFTSKQLTVLALLLPFQLLILYAWFIYGLANPAYFIGTLAGLFALPWLFLLVYAPFLPSVDGARLARYLCWCIFLAAAWGILLFFLHPITGKFLEIPYLTVNIADYGHIETTKHIQRGLFYKLIATYNNGNVYGAATIILLPLYNLLEASRLRRYTLKLALLLTLSRTVWAGLVAAELIPFLVLLLQQLRTLPIIRLAGAGRRFLAVAGTLMLVGGAVLFVQSGSSSFQFLFDITAGGRSGEINFHGVNWLPAGPIPAFNEVIYGSALSNYGILGLIAFILIFASPLLLLLCDRSALRSPLRRAALEGLILYAFIGFSDGALDFIPVMAFYWFAYMIYIFGWPSAVATTARRTVPAATRGIPPSFVLAPGDMPS